MTDIGTQLSNIKIENDLRIKIIIPLMKALGAHKVEDWHGPSEKGIDIYFSYKNIFDEDKHCGILLKISDIKKSRSNDMRNITFQINEALITEFTNPIDNISKIRMEEIYIISNGEINNPAREHIRSFFERNKFTNFRIYDIDKLKEIIKSFLTENSKKFDDNYVFEVTTFDTYCKKIEQIKEQKSYSSEFFMEGKEGEIVNE